MEGPQIAARVSIGSMLPLLLACTATPVPTDTSEPARPDRNDTSWVGTNLTGVVDWSSEWPFVDAFRASRPWIAGSETEWDDGREVLVDARGWPTEVLEGQVVRTLVMWTEDGTPFPDGRYTVLYEGNGTLEFEYAGTLDAAASTDGRLLVDVDHAGQPGVLINLTWTDPADPLRDLRVLMPGGSCEADAFTWCDDATPCADGATCLPFEQTWEAQPFHPDFLRDVEPYRVLRFMDWMDTNSSTWSSWEDRPQLSDARWRDDGVPVEVMVQLANTVQADPWFTLPHLADDGLVQAFAEEVLATLDPHHTVWVERSNEVWNTLFDQADHAREQGMALGLSDDDYQAQLFWHSRRSVEIFELFEEVLGGTDRLVRVLAAQSANPWTGEQVLGFEDAWKHADALGIAPYFGGEWGGADRLAEVSALSVDELLALLETESLPEALAEVEANRAVADTFGLALVAYEGGQHLAGTGGAEDDEALNALFDAVNRDPTMGRLYGDYLQGWQDRGGDVMAHFVHCGRWSKYGRWGAREHQYQPRDEAPKLDAILAVIEDSP